MKSVLVSLVAILAAATLAITGCSSSAPASPSQAAAEATKAPEATKAAQPAAVATQATVAAASKVNWPEKGKPVSLIVPYPAGGGSDIGSRLLATTLEKELGTTVQVVNKAGAGSQVGVTEAAKAKPDGYTVGNANWPTITTLYEDPDRQAAFGRKDLQTVALQLTDPQSFSVRVDSPHKNIDDLIKAAKATPGDVKIGTSGKMSHEHLAILQLQKMTGAKFSIVNFDGGAVGATALLGGHIDVLGGGLSTILSQVKGGSARILATIGNGGDAFVPGVKSLEQQGYKGFFPLGRGWFVPAGTPKEIVYALSSAIKRATESGEYSKKVGDIGQLSSYMDPDQFAKFWEDMDVVVKPLIELAKQD